MEATRKRGFFKGKLAKSLSRVTKVVPCPPSSIPRVSNYHNSLPFDALGDENVDSKATSFISNVRE
ncbi:hypothetical protein Golax_018443, partial [Gossypium laxum]|nr:hypothetical protein [Gossypium laxum]